MIIQKQQSAEQKSEEQAQVLAGEKAIHARIAQSIDLPSNLSGSPEKSTSNPKEDGGDKTHTIDGDSMLDAIEEAENPTVEEEVVEETSEAEDTAEPEALDDDEDLIPKSKVQKRFDELTAEIKQLKAERAKEVETEREQKQQDSELAQLEAMSEQELQTLKRQVKLEMLKSREDDVKLTRLFDLEDKIDRTIQTAPQRFIENQTARFNKAVAQSAQTIDGFDKVKSDIFNYAKAIYDSAPELKSSVYGQERAWKLAVDHYSALRKVSEGKNDTTELKRQVNNLKKKISVDSPSKKTQVSEDSLSKLKRKAMAGNDQDKAEFIKRRMNTDALISDEELRAFRGR